MASKHQYLLNRNGRYYARIVVPLHLRAEVGRSELREPLGADHKVALKGLHRAVAQLQDQISTAEAKVTLKPAAVPMRHPLTSQQMAARYYQRIVEDDTWFRDRDPRYASFGAADDVIVQQLRDAMAGRLDDQRLLELVGVEIEKRRANGNHDARQGSFEWRQLARDLCVAVYEGLSRTAERDEGDFTGKPQHALLRDYVEPEEHRPVDLFNLWDDYVTSRQASGSMRDGGRRQRLAVKSLADAVGHQDAALLTKKDMLLWRDACLKKVSASTVSRVYAPTVRSLFQWAVEDDRLTASPATGLKVAKPKTIQLRERGFTDEEALILLKATLNHMPVLSPQGQPLENIKTTAARRFVPLLCAFTGARVGEITQLRYEDVRVQGETVYIRITPEAGSVKTGQYRDVPLHPQVLSSGFMEHLETTEQGALFHMAPSPDKARRHASKMANRISDWLQEQNLVPEGVKPSHGWRHRFKTVGRELGIADRVLDAIQGHAARTAGDEYGDVTLRTKVQAILKFTSYTV